MSNPSSQTEVRPTYQDNYIISLAERR